WSNTTRPTNYSFTFVDVADLDGNGTREVIGGTSGFLYIYDYPFTVDPWRFTIGSQSNNGTGLVVDEYAGRKKIAVLTANGSLYIFDGPTRTLENVVQQSGGTLLSPRRPAGLIIGDNTGFGRFLRHLETMDYGEEF